VVAPVKQSGIHHLLARLSNASREVHSVGAAFRTFRVRPLAILAGGALAFALGAGSASAAAAPAILKRLVPGLWVGDLKEPGGAAHLGFELNGPAGTSGILGIVRAGAVSQCMGRLRYVREVGAAHRYRFTPKQGICTKGTIDVTFVAKPRPLTWTFRGIVARAAPGSPLSWFRYRPDAV
jgi:hypothetical protein